MMNEYYVITALIENQEDNLNEVNVLGLAKSEQEAIAFADQKIQDVVETYTENDIAYDIEEDDFHKTIMRTDGEETITVEWQIGEVI